MSADVDRTIVARLRKQIPENRFLFTHTRSGGPGGQNVNKVSTRVTLWFNLSGDESFDQVQKRRLRKKLGGRVTKEGLIRVVSMRHRTQRANRRAVIERFYELLADALVPPRPRKRTRVPAAARKLRLIQKRKRGQMKKLRRSRFEECDD